MCGICGFLIITNNGFDKDLITANMNINLKHRGPDGEGFFSDDFISLAMRRLSIIDLEGGWQPIYNEDGTLVLVANGEIYNYIELRELLEKSGHRFSTKSDCEAILHLYEQYGTKCVNHLRGMFAFALWDISRKKLILARDRLGEKPLYYYVNNKFFLFASELKALLSSKIIPFNLDLNSINLYFYYQYVPDPKTPIKDVKKLPAGHLLTIEIDPMRIFETCYWRMQDSPKLEGNPGDLIRSVLDEISTIIIRSDVPIGIALSGGFDSSAIAALTASKYPDIMHAFCIGYPDLPLCDERPDAQKLADYLGMPFHDIELKTSDFVSIFPDLVYFRDDPIADISSYGYYAVMKLAHDHSIPVMLQGQGGDELFFGYPWLTKAVLQSIKKQNLLKKKSSWIDLYEFQPPITLSPPDIIQWIQSLGGIKDAHDKYQKFIISPEDQLVFIDSLPDFSSVEENSKQIFTTQFLQQVNKQEPYSLFTVPLPWDHVDIILTKLIIQTYLLENGIAQGDRLSMASSVELRLPLVDYRLVETVIGLRKTYKDYNLQPKTWFKAAMKNIVPDWVMNRPKRGFTPPVQDWHNAIFKEYGELLNGGYLVTSGVINSNCARKLTRGIYPHNSTTPLSFKALTLELWCRKMYSTSQ